MRAALALAAALGACSAERIVIAGDSWGTEGDSAFRSMLSTYKPSATMKNIAIGGTTAEEWVLVHQGALRRAIGTDTTNLWLTLGGNDAIQGPLPACAAEGKSAAECTDAEVARVEKHVTILLNTVHEANPKTRVLGFGYDIMGMANLPICPALARGIFPQCAAKNVTTTFPDCFNTQFVKIQQMWDRLAAKFEFVDTVSMLGTLQAAGGDKSASIGHPDLSKFSPTSLMQSNCIHPTRGWTGGFGQIFKAQWPLYWQKQLQ
eukprot:TRINITY_DN6619_c0_g1_i3.p1 TRINITY_DN6619_c0_g1~~TRINITY_DN6619_c0_g1_i3.p1  ORF type:complete len:294 (+),score=120.29 TRINITY_DN6619_c0_g1_i3:98-883(+)